MEKDNTDFKERIRKDLMDAPKEMVVNLLLDMNFRPNDISQIAIILCEAWDGCKNCPCVWDNADKRTEEVCLKN